MLELPIAAEYKQGFAVPVTIPTLMALELMITMIAYCILPSLLQKTEAQDTLSSGRDGRLCLHLRIDNETEILLA
jgi:hypothetical protein